MIGHANASLRVVLICAALVGPQDQGDGIASIAVQDSPTADEVREAIVEAQLSLQESAFAREAGEGDAAREMVAQAVEDLRRVKDVPSKTLLLLFAQINDQAINLGMVSVRLEVGSWLVDHLASTQDESNSTLIDARNSLAKTRFDASDYKGALDLWEEVLDVAQRHLDADDPNVTVSRSNVSMALYQLGEYEMARELQETVLAARAGLPETNSRRLEIQEKYALTLVAMGEIDEALEIQREVLTIREAIHAKDAPEVLRARENLALVLFQFCEFEGALDLLETVVSVREQKLGQGDVNLLRAQSHVAIMHEALGDLDRARMLQQDVLETCVKGAPAYRDLRRTAQNNLAVTMFRIGDLELSRELQEAVLAEAVGELNPDHADLLRVRNNLAMTLRVMEDLEGARKLLEAVLEVRMATLPSNDRDLLGARGNLALILHDADEFEAARAMEVAVLAGLEETLSSDHPDVIGARTNLGRTLYELGEFESARELQESVLEHLDHLPLDNPDLLVARAYLALTTHTLGDRDKAGALLDDQLLGILGRFERALTAAAREARAISQEEANHLAGALFLSESGAFDRNQELFCLLETRRHVATHSSNVRCFQGREIEQLRTETMRLSSALNTLVLAGPAQGQATDTWRAAIAQASIARDLVQQRVFEALDESGNFVRTIETAQLAKQLPENSVAVGFHYYDRWQFDENHEGIEYDNPNFLAMVLLADGTVRRVELGSAEDLDKKIRAWRTAVGKPLPRGVSPGPDESVPSEEQRARELREALLDPVLAVIGEATTLHVCLDDILHLVPLDALLFEGGDRVGDRFAIRHEISFARLLAPPPPSTAEPSLLALGDVDFDAGIPVDLPRGDLRVAGIPIDASADRASPWGEWIPLPGTKYEVRDLADLFESNFGRESLPLLGEDATKTELRAAVVGKRHVHLATHGWFTPNAVHSLADMALTDPFAQRLHDTVRGFAPLTLCCGLCLAGANAGKDADGRMEGLLTAQELAGFDLSACDLAVLSACETNVGIHRAGQGILSLQTALHAAGARTTLTSLWDVRDQATGDLMVAFYNNLWKKRMGKAEALWAAKRTLRSRPKRYAVETWSGWVLTGDPD